MRSFVLAGSPLLRIYHDCDRGWQFHGSEHEPATEKITPVVSRRNTISLERTVIELQDFLMDQGPYGSRQQARGCQKSTCNSRRLLRTTCYLEEAVFISQYRDNVHPPLEAVRNNLSLNTSE